MEDEDAPIRRFDVKFTEGSMGVGVETPEGMDEGSVVTEVVPGGPADKGKVRVGDTLVAIGDEDITHLDHEFTHRLISNSKRPIVLHFETTRAKTAIEKDWSELKKVRNDYVSVCRMDLNSAASKSKNMIDEQDYQHNLALCYACADGNYDAVKKALIDKEILAVDDTSDNGYIVLNNKGIVETKVNYVVDWQDKNSDGDTAAHFGAYAGNKQVLQLLFRMGWTPTLKNYSNITIYQTAKDYVSNIYKSNTCSCTYTAINKLYISYTSGVSRIPGIVD